MKIECKFISRTNMIQMFKIILNQVGSHCFKYFKEITRQPYRENFFYNRIVNIWNQLPSENCRSFISEWIEMFD